MERLSKNKLSIFLSAIILVSASLIMVKIFNNSYALPDVKKPVIEDLKKTSDNPLQIKMVYNLDITDDSDYTVEINNKTDNKTYREETFNKTGSNEYLIENVVKGKTYEFSVKLCSEGICQESDSDTIEIPGDENETPSVEPVVVGKITNLKLSGTTASSILLRWNPAPNATSYKLKYKLTTASGWSKEHAVSGTSANIKSLRANTKYDVAILGIRDGVAQNNNNWVIGTYSTNPSVPNVAGFTAKTLSYSQIELNFKKASNKKLYYGIYRSTNNKNWKCIATIKATNTSYIDKKLSANTYYYYKMRVIDKTTQKGKTFYGNYTGAKRVKTKAKNSKTYIVVSIKKQKLWFYKKGKLVLKSNVVTGRKGKTNTPKGTYKIRGKSRSAYLVGRDYVSFVNYWMLIDSSTQIGLHDATWRSSFGGSIYKRNGSHGCINLPYKVAKKIYKKAPVGTKVIVK